MQELCELGLNARTKSEDLKCQLDMTNFFSSFSRVRSQNRLFMIAWTIQYSLLPYLVILAPPKYSKYIDLNYIFLGVV